MKTLLLVAHGSRRKESNQEIETLTAKLAAMSHEFDYVSCAFLEIATPLIPQGLKDHIAKGADEIVVLPYFLSEGRHVVKDVPLDVESVQSEYPKVKITIAPYLGSSDKLLEILLDLSGKKY